jgi:uncharacterized protein YegL
MTINDLMNTLKENSKSTEEILSVFILLDRSSSMSGARWENAIGSINEYVRTLKTEDVKAEITTVAFDSYGTNAFGFALDFNVIRNAVYLNEYTEIDANEIKPRGGTPLYDATAQTINCAIERNNPKTVIVIMTDGEENSSKENNLATIKTRIAECESRDWDVLFLGAEFNADIVASSYGIDITKVLNTSDSATLSSAMSYTATNNAEYLRSGTRADTTAVRKTFDK